MYFIIVILYVIVLCEIIVVNKLSNDLTVLWKKFEVIRSQNRYLLGLFEQMENRKKISDWRTAANEQGRAETNGEKISRL